MRVYARCCFDVLRGYSFAIEEHGLIRDWALRNDHEAIVRLDHGIAGEEYEEAIMLLFGVGRRCRFILWRNPHIVVVQPLIGRRNVYRSVHAALRGTLINRPARHAGSLPV